MERRGNDIYGFTGVHFLTTALERIRLARRILAV